MLIALTNIKYGDEEGKVTEISAGSEVDTGDLPEEVIDDLKKSGAIAEPIQAVASGADAEALIVQLQNRIANLESERRRMPEAQLVQGQPDPEEVDRRPQERQWDGGIRVDDPTVEMPSAEEEADDEEPERPASSSSSNPDDF